jgi:D-alanyl-lipoteichoic acid acyltransferase DltB (MBOAT superfamily)
MDSASFSFVVFGLFVCLISNLSPARAWRNAVLMAASIALPVLIAGSAAALLPLACFLIAGYIGIAIVERGWHRHVAWIVLALIAAYAWMKKYTFLPGNMFLTFPYSTLGLSYIFFRVLHLLIDSANNESQADERNRIGFRAYILYTLNFTTFISGPIQKFGDFAKDQFAEKPIGLGLRVTALQLERIVRGFFKVNVLGMLFDMARADAVTQMSQPLPFSGKFIFALRLALVYPLFLYANFSGYIDIVIALGRLLRLRLPENFDRPFSASSFIDFWNRWHITLSTWLKTYVYNPLLMALMRRFTSNTLQPYLGALCFFVTFFLIGLWHGRTSEFMFFGFLQGAGVAGNKLWQIWITKKIGRKSYRELSSNSAYVALSRGLNYIWFSFTLFWFWADWKLIEKIFAGLTAAQWFCVWLTAWIATTTALALWEWLRARFLSIMTSEGPLFTSRYARVVYATAMGMASFVITVLLNERAPGIVYKAF